MTIRWSQVLGHLKKNAPLATTDARVGAWQLPDDYVEFLSQANGGNGWIGDNYVVLERREDLEEANRALELQDHFPAFLVFGSDGGDELFAFDFSCLPPRIVMLAGSTCPSDVIELAGSFRDFLDRLLVEDLGDIISDSSDA